MKYYLNTNGQQGGPFELSELLINGLTPQSYVWNETMTNWAPAMQVPEVAALLQQQQPATTSTTCIRPAAPYSTTTRSSTTATIRLPTTTVRLSATTSATIWLSASAKVDGLRRSNQSVLQ